MRLGVCPSSSTRSGTVSQSVWSASVTRPACQTHARSRGSGGPARRGDGFRNGVGGRAARSLTRPCPVRRWPRTRRSGRRREGKRWRTRRRRSGGTSQHPRMPPIDPVGAASGPCSACRIAIVSTVAVTLGIAQPGRGRAPAVKRHAKTKAQGSDRAPDAPRRRRGRPGARRVRRGRGRHRQRHRRALRTRHGGGPRRSTGSAGRA